MNRNQDKLFLQLKSTDSAVEQYQLVSELLQEGLRCSVISRQSGIADYRIRHLARLHHKLHDAVKELFIQGKISFSLARAVAGLPDKQQENSARKAIAMHTSVQTFRLSLQQNTDKQLERNLERLSDRASALSGLDITIVADRDNSRAGSWVIRYTDLSMFDTIVEKVTGQSSLDDD